MERLERFYSRGAVNGARLTAGVALASIKMWLSFSTRQDRIEICDHDSLAELNQVLKDQLTPAISARLHKQSTFRKPAKFDWRETEIFRKRTNLRRCAVIVARQEHDSPAPCTAGSWSRTAAAKWL